MREGSDGFRAAAPGLAAKKAEKVTAFGAQAFEKGRAEPFMPGLGRALWSVGDGRPATLLVSFCRRQLWPFHGTSQRSRSRIPNEKAKAQAAMTPMPTNT